MSLWTAFPEVIATASEPMWRIHRAANHPAWFGTSGDWRFDPPPSHRGSYGACYLGVDDRAAYLEVFARLRPVASSDISIRRRSALTPSRDLTLADLTDPSVVGDFGVTAAISTGPVYAEAQALSARLHDAGFDGVRYRVGHDPSMALEGVALFGDPGEQPTRFSEIKTDDVPGPLIDHMWTKYGLEVVPDAPLP